MPAKSSRSRMKSSGLKGKRGLGKSKAGSKTSKTSSSTSLSGGVGKRSTAGGGSGSKGGKTGKASRTTNGSKRLKESKDKKQQMERRRKQKEEQEQQEREQHIKNALAGVSLSKDFVEDDFDVVIEEEDLSNGRRRSSGKPTALDMVADEIDDDDEGDGGHNDAFGGMGAQTVGKKTTTATTTTNASKKPIKVRAVDDSIKKKGKKGSKKSLFSDADSATALLEKARLENHQLREKQKREREKLEKKNNKGKESKKTKQTVVKQEDYDEYDDDEFITEEQEEEVNLETKTRGKLKMLPPSVTAKLDKLMKAKQEKISEEMKEKKRMQGWKLINILSTDSIKNAIKLFRSTSLLAIPVFDVNKNEYLGTLEYLDVLHRLCECKNETEMETFSRQSISQEFGFDNTPWIAVESWRSLLEIVDTMKKFGLNRVPVVQDEDDDTVINMITDSGLLGEVFEFVKEKDLDGEERESVGSIWDNAHEPIVCAQPGDAISSVIRLLQEERCRSVAIVDEDRRFIGKFGAKEMRAFQMMYFDELEEVVKGDIVDFLHNRCSINDQLESMCTSESVLFDLMDRMNLKRYHRLYVVDDLDKRTIKYAVDLRMILSHVAHS